MAAGSPPASLSAAPEAAPSSSAHAAPRPRSPPPPGRAPPHKLQSRPASPPPSARTLASQPQRPREEEEPPPQHPSPNSRGLGGVVLCGLYRQQNRIPFRGREFEVAMVGWVGRGAQAYNGEAQRTKDAGQMHGACFPSRLRVLRRRVRTRPAWGPLTRWTTAVLRLPGSRHPRQVLVLAPALLALEATAPSGCRLAALHACLPPTALLPNSGISHTHSPRRLRAWALIELWATR